MNITKTVVMTGGTSGIGEVAAKQIFGTPNTRLLLGARNGARTQMETLPLDLARLESVRAFTKAVAIKLGDTPIDALVLNAGTQFSNLNQRTVDGFETTFAVNHLAHYLILRLLFPMLAQGAVVVITTSNTHDPANHPLGPKQLDPEKLAHPLAKEGAKGFTAGFRAYASSKLCNLLTARALAASQEAKALNLRVIAYTPGLIPGTSLFRVWPLWARILMGMAGFMRPMTGLNTVAQAGGTLADLALGRIIPTSGHIYASLVKRHLTWPEPSALARNDDTMAALWSDSAAMVGLADARLAVHSPA
jgi:NAD(P)-dependent dehydrogenase (short-subunit alcohol dehydrogenase family)